MIDRFDRFGMSFGHSMGEPFWWNQIWCKLSGSFSGILDGSFETMQLDGQISSSDQANRRLGISPKIILVVKRFWRIVFRQMPWSFRFRTLGIIVILRRFREICTPNISTYPMEVWGGVFLSIRSVNICTVRAWDFGWETTPLRWYFPMSFPSKSWFGGNFELTVVKERHVFQRPTHFLLPCFFLRKERSLYHLNNGQNQQGKKGCEGCEVYLKLMWECNMWNMWKDRKLCHHLMQTFQRIEWSEWTIQIMKDGKN